MYPHHLGSNTSTNDEISSSQPHHPHHYDSNSPFLQDHDGVVLSYLLSQQQFLMMDSNSSQSAEINVAASNQGLLEKEKIQSSKKKKKAAAPRKRSSGNKDRHSKICTAQGPRDRRMRLSVHIARKFFDLQDMLGFDKASKTIDWLFTKSKSAIKELKQHMILPSCNTSTIDAANYINSLSTSKESNEGVSRTMQTQCVPKGESSMGMNKDPKQNMRRLCRVGKGSRDEARARARERTREKMRIRSGCKTNQAEENPKDIGLCLGNEAQKLTNHELLEQAGANCMMRINADEYKTLKGRSISASRSGPSLEDDGGEFPCFAGNWGTKMQSFQRTTNVIKTFTGNRVMQVENPSAPIMGMTNKQQEPSNTTTSLHSFNGSNSQEQKYSGSSVFMTPIPKPNTVEVLNPSSINFMPNQDEDRNRNAFFITTLISQVQNPAFILWSGLVILSLGSDWKCAYEAQELNIFSSSTAV